MLVACSRKDLSYRHESEVRIIILQDSKNPDTKLRFGIRLPVDIERLITEVMVGPREQKWVVRLVEQVMERYGLPQQVVASDRLTPRRYMEIPHAIEIGAPSPVEWPNPIWATSS